MEDAGAVMGPCLSQSELFLASWNWACRGGKCMILNLWMTFEGTKSTTGRLDRLCLFGRLWRKLQWANCQGHRESKRVSSHKCLCVLSLFNSVQDVDKVHEMTWSSWNWDEDELKMQRTWTCIYIYMKQRWIQSSVHEVKTYIIKPICIYIYVYTVDKIRLMKRRLRWREWSDCVDEVHERKRWIDDKDYETKIKICNNEKMKIM